MLASLLTLHNDPSSSIPIASFFTTSSIRFSTSSLPPSPEHGYCGLSSEQVHHHWVQVSLQKLSVALLHFKFALWLPTMCCGSWVLALNKQWDPTMWKYHIIFWFWFVQVIVQLYIWFWRISSDGFGHFDGGHWFNAKELLKGVPFCILIFSKPCEQME